MKSNLDRLTEETYTPVLTPKEQITGDLASLGLFLFMVGLFKVSLVMFN